MKNEYLNNAADSSAEDIIRALTQFGCAEVHAKSLYEQARAELDNALIEQDEIPAQLEKIERLERNIITYAELRRKATMALYQMYEGGDKKKWCMIKHLSVGAYTAFEAWQGSDNDPALLDLAYDANRAFTEAITEFIGAEITDCAACLGDFLKGGNNATDQE